jgi:hypothetical protein
MSSFGDSFVEVDGEQRLENRHRIDELPVRE